MVIVESGTSIVVDLRSGEWWERFVIEIIERSRGTVMELLIDEFHVIDEDTVSTAVSCKVAFI